MCKRSNLITRYINTDVNVMSYSLLSSAMWICVACACMVYAQHAKGAGGCGSVCLPLEALDPERSSMLYKQYRILYSLEHANFDNFRAGDSDINNPGGNKAEIIQSTVFIDYGLSEKFTTSILIPYIKKEQQTNKFGTRIAEGVGDLSIFGHYEYMRQSIVDVKSATIGLGIKFPTGSIDEPSSDNRLPPAFQVGSGAYDLVPTTAFYYKLSKGSIFGDIIWRIPLEANKRGYKFGQEIELNIGGEYMLPGLENKYSFLLATSLLHAEHDEDNESILPGRLREGSKVLNTGGDFVDLVLGLRVKVLKKLAVQLRFSVPIHENWNGNSATNVGQVAPDLTTQINVVYTGGK